MTSPFISIITVVYNGAKTLERSIKSITEQSYHNSEYIIIDGGSTDGTIDLIKKYPDKISYWISEPDNGIYDAMNKGIGVARGQWLYFLGCDDTLYDNTVLEKVSNSLTSCDCNFFYGDVIMGLQKRPYDGVFDYDKLLKHNISHQALFFRKELFEKLGMYDTRYRIYADWDFNIRCFKWKGLKPLYCDIIIAHFQTGGTSSHYDVLFLRQSIIPLRMERLLAEPGKLKTIKTYDQWWRLFRNAEIRSLPELYQFTDQKAIPSVIGSMILWQQKVPLRFLKFGFISKLCMGLNYLFNRRRMKQ